MDNSKTTIFIIDDEEPIRKVLNTHLTKEGYCVVQSSGGNGIFDALKSNIFDLVICDIKMPEVEGTAIIEFVRANFDTVPIIMLTGLTDVAVAVDVMRRGAFDYIMKPVKKEDLLSAIRKALMHRELLVRNRQLEKENKDYQLFLEEKVVERTNELDRKTRALEDSYLVVKSMNVQFATALAEFIEAKDHHTRGHCNRMRRLCVELGMAAGMNDKAIETIEYASLLHDLGKVGVREEILNKEGTLTEEENKRMRAHPEIGEKILMGIPLMEEVAKITVAHHENYDGSGYPRGLKGEEIPLSARIIAVADIYDAMASDRPYRKGLPLDVIFREMRKVAGAQLDPSVVELFIDKQIYKVTMEMQA